MAFQLCCACSRSQEVGLGLGAQAGEARIREVVDRSRLQPFPPSDGNTLQHSLRSETVTPAFEGAPSKLCLGRIFEVHASQPLSDRLKVSSSPVLSC